ncbi:TonB-dependent hemoglobin/transferrin/lactoferrin family receptor [Leptolyngbya sp. AN02str]|uniref:TonB-dependent hemoglobin/transferrin/lactoferrin family receptor n=1 Tax=Leptolyngbya sp. AN02str TaxID=3423363 RepID=UPI003D315560
MNYCFTISSFLLSFTAILVAVPGGAVSSEGRSPSKAFSDAASSPLLTSGDTASVAASTLASRDSSPEFVVHPASTPMNETQVTEAQINEAQIPRLSQIEPSETRSDTLAQVFLDPTEAEGEAEDDGRLRITITGTRTPRKLQDAPANITVITRQNLDRNLVQDIRDIVRYEPGVVVRNNSRYGLQDFNIRGLDGNRVLLQVDGIRLPTRFEFGPFALGRDYVDTEILNSLEIIRGPASALYGSDALGGVVSYFSLQPNVLLNAVGQDSFRSAALNFDSANQGLFGTGLFANRFGNLSLLLGYTRRGSSEGRVAGDDTFVDEEDGRRDNFIGGLTYEFDEFSTLGFTGEVFRDRQDISTARANLAPDVFFEDVDLNTRRDRLSLSYTYDNELNPSFLQFGRLQLYYQNSQQEELRRREFSYGVTSGRQFPIGTPTRRDDDYDFTDRVFGANLQLRSDFALGNLDNRLTYGVDISTTRNERPRDRTETNLLTGDRTQISSTDTFPIEDFPPSDTFRLGLYVQNEIELSGGQFSLIPGLRFDVYDLSTEASDIFTRNGAEAANYNSSALSPSLALLYRPTSEITFVGRYARGFRAPLYSEINSGFSNTSSPFFKYRTISNPDLEAETSNTFELGMRGNFDRLSFGLTGFYSRYNNFIEQFVDAGTQFLNPAPPFGTPIVNVFQTQNVASAQIYGLEFGGEYRFSPGPDGFRLRSALAWTRGDNLTDDVPLESVSPFQLVAGLGYRAPQDRWGTELVARFVGNPRVERAANTAGQQPFIPNSYTVVDVLGYVSLSPNVSLNLGVFNLFNTEYYEYADVRGFVDRPDIGRFSQPGTTFRGGLSWRF